MLDFETRTPTSWPWLSWTCEDFAMSIQDPYLVQAPAHFVWPNRSLPALWDWGSRPDWDTFAAAFLRDTNLYLDSIQGRVYGKVDIETDLRGVLRRLLDSASLLPEDLDIHAVCDVIPAIPPGRVPIHRINYKVQGSLRESFSWERLMGGSPGCFEVLCGNARKISAPLPPSMTGKLLTLGDRGVRPCGSEDLIFGVAIDPKTACVHGIVAGFSGLEVGRMYGAAEGGEIVPWDKGPYRGSPLLIAVAPDKVFLRAAPRARHPDILDKDDESFPDDWNGWPLGRG